MEGYNTKEKLQESWYLNAFVWKLLIGITKKRLKCFFIIKILTKGIVFPSKGVFSVILPWDCNLILTYV